MKYIILLLSVLNLYASSTKEVKIIDLNKVKNDKSRESMQKWLDGDFGLQTYKVNYLLPYGYATKDYHSIGPVVYDNIEAELQVSLKIQVAKNLFGLHESYYAAYSQQSFWQLYIYSAPFRETNYNPEAFVIFPVDDTLSFLKLRSLKFAIAHKSNGQPNTQGVSVNGIPLGNLSKSINYVYSSVRMQHGSHITDLTVWAPLGTGDNLSDNPDLMDYIGYGSIKFTYFYFEHMFTLMARGNFATGKGAMEATYSYPLYDKTNLYVKLFSGYEESLIDYNRNLTKFAIGFSFSR